MRRLSRRLAPQLLAIALATTGLGCSKIREISACRKLSGTVNEALSEVEALAKTKGAEQETRMAKRYAELAKQLEPMSSGESPLAVNVREYVAVLRATDAALRGHAEASRNRNNARMNELRRELDRLVKRERAAATRIDVECHS
jgi:hypothetical protein